MKIRKMSVLLVMILVLTFVFVGCEHEPDYSTWKISGSKNIIFPKDDLETLYEVDGYFRTAETLKYVGDDEMLNGTGFQFITQYDDPYEIRHSEDEFLIFNDDLSNPEKFNKLKENNSWGEGKPENIRQYTLWEYWKYGDGIVSENKMTIIQQFAKEELAIDGVCNNVIKDKFDRMMGGILIPNGDSFDLYAVAMQGINEDKDCYYDKNAVMVKIDLDNYLVELNEFQKLNNWNEEITPEQVTEYDYYEVKSLE